MKPHPSKKTIFTVAILAVAALCAGLFAFATPAAADEGVVLANSKIIVALDPGHGGGDSGAVGNGLEERDLNWKISQATKEWLEAHGVNVVLTHNGEWASNSEHTPSRKERTDRAYEQGACVVISQHINSAENVSAQGFEMWVPNSRSGYHANTIDAANKLWLSLRPKLEDLGLVNRGKKTSTGGTYPDGSPADVLGMVYYPRLKGMTGVIIEHAFISNEDDAKLLADDAFLKKLGIADAEAIYENLTTFYQVYRENQADADAIAKINAAAEGSVFRLYNQWSHAHLFTSDKREAIEASANGWTYENVLWVAPTSGSVGIYRLYNPNNGDHHYTDSRVEAASLESNGWTWEGSGTPALYGASEGTAGTCAIYRLFNPYEEVGTHLYTTSKSEYDAREADGWVGEGIAFYGIDPKSIPSDQPQDDVEEPEPEPTGTPIMGESATSREALKSWFASAMKANGKAYNALYAEKGAPTPEDFVQILWEEATAEGVRPDVLLSQVIKETGWLQFGGLVKVEDCNFGGIGATDSAEGRTIATFSDVRCGLRAQVQHLRAYADPGVTRGNLANECVDPRFDLVNPKGKSPSVEGLSKNWASSENYGEEIVSFMDRQFPNDLA